jgi:hypothetical protein
MRWEKVDKKNIVLYCTSSWAVVVFVAPFLSCKLRHRFPLRSLAAAATSLPWQEDVEEKWKAMRRKWKKMWRRNEDSRR